MTKVRCIRHAWLFKGLCLSSSELLHFAYLAQCRCDPENTPAYFESLFKIVDALSSIGRCPASLETLIVSERSRGRFTSEGVADAVRTLGFGTDNDLRLEYDEEVDDEFIKNAWRSALRRSWKEIEGASRRRELNEAFRIVAESRSSLPLIRDYEDEQLHGMTPDQAYDTLEVPMGVEEDMLITVYNMRVRSDSSYGLHGTPTSHRWKRNRRSLRRCVTPCELSLNLPAAID